MSKLKGRQLVGRLRLPTVPAVELRPLNSFYKPQVAPVVSNAMLELTQSLGNLVPALRQYEQTEEKVEQVEQSDLATEAYHKNKQSFLEAVNKGLIPEGANPYFVKKYLELDLKNKAVDFKETLFYEYGQQKLQNRTDEGAFEAFFNKTLEDFKTDKNLTGYNIVDLDSYFLNEVANIRSNLEQQHIQGRIGLIENEAKKTFKQSGFNVINNGRTKTLDEIKLEFDTSEIRPSEIKATFMASNLQELADGAIASGLNKDDVNAIITDLVKQAAVEAEDPDILKVFNYIEQGAGGIMANTSEVRLVIEKTKDEIIAKQATKIKQYNLNKTYLEGRKQEILNDGFLTLIKDQEIEKLTIDDLDVYLSGEFATPEGDKLTITPNDYERFYKLHEGFLTAATVVKNDAEILLSLQTEIMENPSRIDLIEKITDAMKAKDLNIPTAEALIEDIKKYKAIEKHPYMRSPEMGELETYIDDIVTQYRTFSGTEGINIFLARKINDKVKVFAKNLLFDPKYYGDENPLMMSPRDRKIKLTLTQLVFDELVTNYADSLIAKIKPEFTNEATKQLNKLNSKSE